MTTPAPTVTDHDDFERLLLELRKREKALTCEGDAIAATRLGAAGRRGPVGCTCPQAAGAIPLRAAAPAVSSPASVRRRQSVAALAKAE
jgi:hypothetical protein